MNQPIVVRVQFMLTDVDSCDSGHVDKLTSDGHSSTAGQWTVQWSHTVHWNLMMWHCTFNRIKPYIARILNSFICMCK